MREQLIQYVNLLFAGAPDAAEIRQEILQNTLDRYDDLIAQGKTPEAAYSLAISGIGDISELLSREPATGLVAEVRSTPVEAKMLPLWKKLLRAVAIFLYIISIVPLLVLSEMNMGVLGLCATISVVAVATVAIILSSGGSEKKEEKKEEDLTPRRAMRKAVKNAISSVGLVIYLVVSFATGAWYITWLIFPIMAALEGLVMAFMDLKEDGCNEED